MRQPILAFAAILATGPCLAAEAEKPMTPAPIVFFDIAGPDAAKLKAFYADNFAWSIDSANMIRTPSLEGTVRQDPPEKVLYIGVPDLDAAMARVNASGGEIVSPKIPIPTGMFVLFKDPAGNRMGLVQTK